MFSTISTISSEYSTTRTVTRQQPVFEKQPQDKFETVLFLPEGEARQGQGGLRSQGYFKTSLEGKPLITVVTVVFNGEQFLEETIQSVINQTYDNVEYIIIDGDSTDGALDIIKKYEDRIDYWVSESDKGISDAFNKGLAVASGDYVLYLNSDDKLANATVVTEMVGKICEYAFPALIYADIEYIDRKTEQVMHRVSTPFSPRELIRGKMIPHPSLFTHRSYFAEYGAFDITFRIAMDYEWLLRGALKEKLIYVPMLVTSFRDGGVSTVNNQSVRNEIIAALKKNGFITSHIAEMKMRIYFSLRFIARSVLNRFL